MHQGWKTPTDDTQDKDLDVVDGYLQRWEIEGLTKLLSSFVQDLSGRLKVYLHLLHLQSLGTQQQIQFRDNPKFKQVQLQNHRSRMTAAPDPQAHTS